LNRLELAPDIGENGVEGAALASQCKTVNREQVIERLRQHEAELKGAGITRLSLFGSVARGERGNDVDLMAEFDSSRQFSLLDMVGLENRLADILGVKVDLSPAKQMKGPVRRTADREAVLAF
jgi:uncharacterized protein